jgi:hypothetical protein
MMLSQELADERESAAAETLAALVRGHGAELALRAVRDHAATMAARWAAAEQGAPAGRWQVIAAEADRLTRKVAELPGIAAAANDEGDSR